MSVGGPKQREVEQCVPQQLRSTAQTSLTMLGFGLGGIASNLLTGWVVDAEGAAAPFLIGGVGAMALGLAVAWVLPPPHKPQPRATG